MKQKHKRLVTIIGVFICVSLGTVYLLNSFKDNLVYYHSPSEIITMNNEKPDMALQTFQKRMRIGGMIEKGTINNDGNGTYSFTVTDAKNEAVIKYKGILPPMFREGQGVVAEGKFEGIEEGVVYFKASTLITKHDENYMPPEVAKSMKK